MTIYCTADECWKVATMITDYHDDMPNVEVCDDHAMGIVIPLTEATADPTQRRDKDDRQLRHHTPW